MEEAKSYRDTVDGLSVYEIFEEPLDDSDLGLYPIVIEPEVKSHEELESKNNMAVQLAEDLELLWSYVGPPMLPSKLTKN